MAAGCWHQDLEVACAVHSKGTGLSRRSRRDAEMVRCFSEWRLGRHEGHRGTRRLSLDSNCLVCWNARPTLTSPGGEAVLA